MADYHRFDEEAAWRDTFKGVVIIDSKPWMDGPHGLVPVRRSAVQRYHRAVDDAYGQGYHDVDAVIQGITEQAYWEAIKIVSALKADGYSHLIPSLDDSELLPPPPEELPLIV